MTPKEPAQISLRWRIGLWILAWVIATIATIEGGFELLLYAWMFPYGLLALFTPKNWDPPINEVVILVTAWAMYVVLTIVGLLQKKRVRYFIAFGILCVLLALNVVGCHVLINQPINIGG